MRSETAGNARKADSVSASSDALIDSIAALVNRLARVATVLV
jgi:hypothetical protein